MSSDMILELKNRVKLLDTVTSNFSCNLRKRRRHLEKDNPPKGLEEPCQELYSLLYPSLVERNTKSNVAALIMGKRGSGKTLVVQHTLAALQQQATRPFRVVHLNGLVIRGHDVGYAVKEIIRQLSDIALTESTSTTSPSRYTCCQGKNLLRLRQSSFTSNLALLDEVLKMASIDQIPILMVLDEFDALLGSSASSLLEPGMKQLEGGATAAAVVADRQLLFYYLLDRVTTSGTCLCIIAMTSHLAAVTMLEKRVKSRAEGISKVIFLNPYPTYELLVEITCCKITTCNNTDEEEVYVKELQETIFNILSKPTEDRIVMSNQEQQRIQHCFQRNYALGKDVRWFGRVVLCALSLYRQDIYSLLLLQKQTTTIMEPSTDIPIPTFQPHYFWQALISMNASLAHTTSALQDDDGMAANPRIQALLDLSGPQVALVLSARRILTRDAQTQDDSSLPKPLTLQRMIQEYQSYRGPNRYSERLLTQSFWMLLETDVLRPSADHVGGAPLQYGYSQQWYAMDQATVSRLPLHLPVDVPRELDQALKDNLLECSTSLRDWGRKNN